MALRSVIAGVGSALPKRQVSNEELAKSVDTSDEWIVERTGIRTRHVAGEGETTATLARDAAVMIENRRRDGDRAVQRRRGPEPMAYWTTGSASCALASTVSNRFTSCTSATSRVPAACSSSSRFCR